MRRLPFPPKVLLLSTTLALLAAIAVVVVLSPKDDDSNELPLEKDETAGIAYTSFADTQVPLSTHRGTPLVVNFFSKDCVPCVKEMPAFESVHQAFGDQVQILGLAVEDRGEDAEAFVQSTGVTYETARDPDGQIIHKLGGQAILPTTVILDADGVVVATHHGELTTKELTKLLHDELDLGPASASTTTSR